MIRGNAKKIDSSLSFPVSRREDLHVLRRGFGNFRYINSLVRYHNNVAEVIRCASIAFHDPIITYELFYRVSPQKATFQIQIHASFIAFTIKGCGNTYD